MLHPEIYGHQLSLEITYRHDLSLDLSERWLRRRYAGSDGYERYIRATAAKGVSATVATTVYRQRQLRKICQSDSSERYVRATATRHKRLWQRYIDDGYGGDDTLAMTAMNDAADKDMSDLAVAGSRTFRWKNGQDSRTRECNGRRSRTAGTQVFEAVTCHGCRHGPETGARNSQRMAEGRVDGRTGGREDGRTGGRADGRTGGRADGRTGGRADGRTGGRADGRTGGRTNGRMGRRTLFDDLELEFGILKTRIYNCFPELKSRQKAHEKYQVLSPSMEDALLQWASEISPRLDLLRPWEQS